MKKLVAAASVAALALASGTALGATKEFDFTGFTRVSAAAGTKVEVTVGPEFSVVAEGEDDAIRKLDLKVDADTLVIARKTTSRLPFQRNGYVKVKVTAPILSALLASSGAKAKAINVDTSEFRVKASTGASAEVTGQCIGLSIEASSGGDADASGLKCEMATAEASSGGAIDLFASKSLVAEASSGGAVNVFGSPSEVDVDKSSGGAVKIRNLD